MSIIAANALLETSSHEVLLAALRRNSVEEYALEARALWKQSNAAAFCLAVVLWLCLDQFGGDMSYKQLVSLLIENGVLQAGDGRFGDKSFLSKLRKIGEFNKEIYPYVKMGKVIGLAPMYELGRYFETCLELKAHPAEKLEECIRENAGDLTGAALKQLADNLRAPGAKGSPALLSKAVAVSDCASTPPLFDLVLVTPNRSQLAGLAGDFAEGTSPVCIRLRERLANDAACVVITPAACVPVLTERLLAVCGFKATKLFLRQRPLGPEITTAEVVLVSAQSRRGFEAELASMWDQNLDPHEHSDAIFRGAKNRLHLFASSAPPGWQADDPS
jgi:hypothetical protein